MATYLDFEQRLKLLQEDIESATLRNDNAAVSILQKDLQDEMKKIYKFE